MKLNENQKIIVTVLVILVVVGALGALNFFKYKERAELLARLGTLKEEEQRANDLIRQIPELRQKRADLANIIDQYTSILPQDVHVEHEAFAEIIDSFRKETQVVIQKMEYLHSADGEEREAEGNFLRHRYLINLIGTFPDFLRFINKVENHTRFLKIDEIKIKPLGAKQEEVGFVTDEKEAETLERAKVPFKEIAVIVSTYTYKKDELTTTQ